MAVAVWERYKVERYNFYAWRHTLSVPKKLALALAWAGVVGLLAQAKIYLPWTPVPITCQTFGALLGGVLLGGWWGGISLAIYAAFGAAGLPWFAGWHSGIPIGPAGLPTGGYIMGFILAALLLGHFTDKYVRSRSFFIMFGLMLLANYGMIYPLGLLQLHFCFPEASFSQLLAMGLTPFIAGDIIKAIIAAGIARGITPKEAYNGEMDKGKWATWPIP